VGFESVMEWRPVVLPTSEQKSRRRDATTPIVVLVLPHTGNRSGGPSSDSESHPSSLLTGNTLQLHVDS